MSVGRVNSVAHNFGHHFLWCRNGFIYKHIARRAREQEIVVVTIDVLGERISPSSLDTSVFRHVISDLRSKFYDCLDSVWVDYDYITRAEITVDVSDYPARRCRCMIRDHYGHMYYKDVEIASSDTRTAGRSRARLLSPVFKNETPAELVQEAQGKWRGQLARFINQSKRKVLERAARIPS
jgi:hypothetical protein